MAKRKTNELRPIRPEVHGFHEAIREDPEDDASRLIFADWLDDFGDETDRMFAQLFRVGCELAKMSADHPDRSAREKAYSDEASAQARRAFAPILDLNPDSIRVCPRDRGLFRLDIAGRSLASAKARPWIESELFLWFDALQFTELGNSSIVGLLRAPVFDRILSLDLGSVPMRPDAMRLLCRAESLTRLRELNLEGHGAYVESEGVRLLAESSLVENLVSLNLRRTRIGEFALHHLAESKGLRKLQRFALGNHFLGEYLFHLAHAEWLPNLRELDLSLIHATDDSIISFLRSPGLSGLRSLSLAQNRLTVRSVHAILNSAFATQLRSLDLSQTSIGDEGVIAFCEWEGVKLDHLNLDGGFLTGEGIRTIEGAMQEGRIRRLTISMPYEPNQGRELWRRFGRRVTIPGINLEEFYAEV